MQVSIDARYIRERPSGIGAYVQALVDRIPGAAPDDGFHLWLHPKAPRPVSTCPNVKETVVRAGANSLSTLLAGGRLVDLDGVDVLHATFNILGRFVRCAAVTTVHDLMWLLAPTACEGLNFSTPFTTLFYRDGILRALERSTRIVAISKATADSIMFLAPEAHHRIRVIHHGVERRFHPPPDRDAVRESVRDGLGVRSPYLLVVGQNSPAKNHANVLRAFAAADLGPHVRLVLLQRLYAHGRFGLQRRQELYPMACKLGIEDRVAWLPRVTDEEVIRLMQGALALVQFSRFEGFGMPALEAMACGTPVVASDIPPLVEVMGGAGVNVPLRVDALAGALRRVVQEPGLREELSGRGLQRAGDFDWDRCASEHLEVYREAAAEGPPG